MTARISIAMCTFNGERHLEEQLASFIDQVRPPDELIVTDDGSSDGTMAAVERFCAAAPFAVRVQRNPVRLGFARNFEAAARLATGDIVLFSDQDDMWHRDKIAEVAGAIEADETVGLAFCDARLVDEDGRPTGVGYWERQGFNRAAQAELAGRRGARLLMKNPAWMAAGATMAYAARYNALIFPFPEGWTHDAWIATVVASQSRVAVIAKQLNDYRQHSTQVYGASMSTSDARDLARQRARSPEHFLATVERYRILEERLLSVPGAALGLLPDIRAKLQHWEARAGMRERGRVGRVPSILREAVSGRYVTCSQGVRSLAMDLLL